MTFLRPTSRIYSRARGSNVQKFVYCSILYNSSKQFKDDRKILNYGVLVHVCYKECAVLSINICMYVHVTI